MRRPAALAAALLLTAAPAALTACGDDDGESTTRTADGGAANAPRYQGRSAQGEPVTVKAARNVEAAVRLNLACKDGSDSSVTFTTEPAKTTLQSDGSFFYEEGGRTKASVFPGFGPGRYRGAMQGRLRGEKGDGTAAFRITFRETSCRARASWRVQLKR